MFDDAVLTAIRDGNVQRAALARQWALGVYVLVALSMMAVTVLLALVVAWATSATLVSALPGSSSVGMATVYIALPLLLLNFLLTAGGGVLGLGVANVVYLGAALGFAVRGQLLILRHKSVLLSGHGPLRNPDGSITKEQLDAEREQMKNYLRVHPTPSQIELRIARFMARYNAPRLLRVPEMLANYRHTEERLIKDLVKKYGPEPELVAVSNASQQPAANGSEAKQSWRRAPLTMYRGQCAAVLLTMLFLVMTVIGEVVAVYVWTIDDYYVVSRETLQPVLEIQPALPAKALQLMYAWRATATDMRLQLVTQWTTSYCGSQFTANLPDSSSRMVIYTDWIQPYHINMSEYLVTDWAQYTSVNEWFTREIDPTFRPLARPNDPLAVSSPADSRLLVYQNVTTAKRVWIKGGLFTWNAMLGFAPVVGDPNYFEGGVVVVARLAPQDYHRFHAPVSGRVISITRLDGTLWSVGADAVQSGNDVFLNARQVILIDTGTMAGVVGYVAVGATCVGSVVAQLKTGANTYRPLQVDDVVQRGDEIGLMQFGGSTVVLLFRRSAFVPSCDILRASRFPVEVLVKVGAAVGSLSNDEVFNGVVERCSP